MKFRLFMVAGFILDFFIKVALGIEKLFVKKKKINLDEFTEKPFQHDYDYFEIRKNHLKKAK